MNKHYLVEYRHLLSPHSSALLDFQWKNFDNNYTKRMYEIGKLDAIEVLTKQLPGERFRQLKEKTKGYIEQIVDKID